MNCRLSILWAAASAVSIGGLLSCAPAPEVGPGPASAESDPSAAPTNRIDIPATVRRNLGITFAPVEARYVAQTIRVPGAFELQPLARHEYRMALPGRVQMLVDQYDLVEPGQPLFRFQSPAWSELVLEIIQGEQAMDTAQAEIEVAKAKQAEAATNMERTRERIEALAQADFKRADLDLHAAELGASLPRLEAELNLAETRRANATRTRRHALLRASAAAGIAVETLAAEIPAEEGSDGLVPRYLTIDWIDVLAVEPGVVEALAVTDGAYVESPDTVLSTVDPALVRFRASALQADLPKLTRAREGRIVPPPSPGIPIEEGVGAKIAIGLESHPQERTVTLLATPDGSADWIRPGVSAFLEVVIEKTDSPALAVPRSAVVRDGLAHVIFRRDPKDPNKAIRVEADLGVDDGRWVVLHSGVMRGDEVVLAGAYELKLATQQSGTTQAGGHFHADGSFHGEH